VGAFIAGIISAGLPITTSDFVRESGLAAEARVSLPILPSAGAVVLSRATMTPYACLKSSSVVARKDAGKRCLRTDDVDGVGLAPE
jgi:hypothetical protein